MASLRPLVSARDYLDGYDTYDDDFCEDEPRLTLTQESERPPTSSLDALAKTIETQIVPRLMLAHRASLSVGSHDDHKPVEPRHEDVLAFATVVMESDIGAARAFIDALRDRGVSLESVFLDLMAPAARHLGDLWVEDRCDFMTVTLALARMQQILRGLSASDGTFEAEDYGKSALLITVPGEQHTFGLFMVGEFFRRGGWEVWGGAPDGEDSVIELLMDRWFDLIGVSVSQDSSLPGLQRFIQRIRKSSRNRQIGVLAGGRAFGGRAELAKECGADDLAVDGREAVRCAEEMVGRGKRRFS